MKRNNSRKAFTIVELVIVIAVIAILAAVMIPTFGNIIDKANESKDTQEAKNAYTNYFIEHDGVVPDLMVYKHSNGKVVLLENGAPTNVYETEEAFFAAYSLPKFEMTAGKTYPISMPVAPDEDEIPLQLNLTVSDYFTISNPDTEKLSCGPGMVYYGSNRMAVAYLADDTQPVESESKTTIICRLGLFSIDAPENGKFIDIAAANQRIGDITIGNKAPYEANLMKVSDSELLILFNIHDSAGKYVYCCARFDAENEAVISYEVLKLDGRDWIPANIATSYNGLAVKNISTAGPTRSMVFTSKIVQYNGYFYGYCGGVCDDFAGILVRSADGINWESVLAPEAASDMKGVIECGFEFVDDTVYFCMRDISSGVYHCSYEWPSKAQLNKTTKLHGLTTSKPATFIQDGKLYLIVNQEITNAATEGRRNTALFYNVDAKKCHLTLARKVFCKGGCAYHTVVNVDGVNYWCFHTDARWIAPVDQGRSNLAFLQIPELYAAESDSADGVLNLNDYSYMFGRGCITVASNTWQAGAVNMHYQIPLADFADFDTVTITANNEQKAYIAFFTKCMIQNGDIAYADGWTEQLIMEPRTVQTLTIPEDAAYLYILNNNAAGSNLLPKSVVFSMQEEAPPATYSLNLDITTYTGCLAGGTSWKTQCDNLCYQFDLSELKAQGYTKMTVTANTSGRALIAMFTEQMPTSGISNAISPKWATGWSKQQQIDAGQTQAFGIPDDATYLFVLYTGTNVSCPQSIVFSK